MKTLPVFVPDASVLLKWALQSSDEDGRDRALELQQMWLSGNCAIVLPSLWFFEVGNILGLKQPNLAPAFMQILTAYRFEEQAPDAIFGKAFELMQKYDVTFYDAVYHAVAFRHSGTMITADEKYHRKTVRAGHVVLLANWAAGHNLSSL